MTDEKVDAAKDLAVSLGTAGAEKAATMILPLLGMLGGQLAVGLPFLGRFVAMYQIMHSLDVSSDVRMLKPEDLGVEDDIPITICQDEASVYSTYMQDAARVVAERALTYFEESGFLRTSEDDAARATFAFLGSLGKKLGFESSHAHRLQYADLMYCRADRFLRCTLAMLSGADLEGRPGANLSSPPLGSGAPALEGSQFAAVRDRVASILTPGRFGRRCFERDNSYLFATHAWKCANGGPPRRDRMVWDDTVFSYKDRVCDRGSGRCRTPTSGGPAVDQLYLITISLARG